MSSFVGRRQELIDVRRLIGAARMVTLTGVGGVGKSRLGVRVAADVRRSFPDGTWLVEFSALENASLVPQAVSGALGIPSLSTREPTDVVADFLSARLLLVLDNCEHLVNPIAVLVAHVLRAAAEVRVLATSRHVLAVPGEHIYPVPPLPVPEPGADVSDAALARYPGLDLFAQRGSAVNPGFAVTADNVDLVARVCQRLDGIPLAIELAAAQLRVMALAQVADRLDRRFDLLASGERGAPDRHQTLRTTVGWSFELCDRLERLVWLRACVFAGWFVLAAAERVCGDGLAAADVLQAVVGLVDKSVLLGAAAVLLQGDLDRCAELCAASAALCRAHGDRWWLGHSSTCPSCWSCAAAIRNGPRRTAGRHFARSAR